MFNKEMLGSNEVIAGDSKRLTWENRNFFKIAETGNWFLTCEHSLADLRQVSTEGFIQSLFDDGFHRFLDLIATCVLYFQFDSNSSKPCHVIILSWLF